MYHQYSTKAVVLKHAPAGEASAHLHLLTKDYGMVRAKAQGIRLINSKLRYSLAEWSRARVTLVRGAHGFRVVGAVFETSYFDSFRAEPHKLKALARIGVLMRRLVIAEASGDELYTLFFGLAEFFARAPLNRTMAKNAEYIAALRLLDVTGYLPRSEPLRVFARDGAWNVSIISRMGALRSEAAREINSSLNAAQL